MKKVTWRRNLVTVVLTVSIVSIIYVLTKGWLLMLPPRMEHIEKVIVTNIETGTEKTFTDDENIDLAVKLINFLNYVPFSTASDTYEPLIKITCVLKNGTVINLSANNTEVFLNGKGHRLKDAGIFVNLAEGVLFLEENEVKEQYLPR